MAWPHSHFASRVSPYLAGLASSCLSALIAFCASASWASASARVALTTALALQPFVPAILPTAPLEVFPTSAALFQTARLVPHRELAP